MSKSDWRGSARSMWMILRDLEQSGAMQLLLVLHQAKDNRFDEKTLTMSVSVIMRDIGGEDLKAVLDKLLNFGLVKRVESDVIPQRYDLELTEKGRSVASQLAEIRLILAEKGRPSARA